MNCQSKLGIILLICILCLFASCHEGVLENPLTTVSKKTYDEQENEISSTPANSSFPSFEVSNEMYTFNVQEPEIDESNSLSFDIIVKHKKQDTVFCVLSISHALYNIPWGKIFICDVNFDGIDDFVVCTGIKELQLLPQYVCFIWDEGTQSFVEVCLPDGAVIDYDDQVIRTCGRFEANVHYFEKYAFEDNKLALIARMTETYVSSDNISYFIEYFGNIGINRFTSSEPDVQLFIDDNHNIEYLLT